MNKVLAVVVFVLLLNKGQAGHVEPRCSKYDFEEKVLEKVLRFEHKMELFTDSIEKIATKVEDTLDRIQKEQETQKSDQTNAFEQLADNTRTDWNEIKTQFGSLKSNIEEQSSTMNGTLFSQLSSFKQSIDDLAGAIHRPSYAFSAYDLSAASGPSRGDILVFAKTHLNENNVYNTDAGKFTAPVDGVYVFHATIDVINSNKYIYVHFNAEGRVIGRFMVGGWNNEDSSSGSAIARLAKGTDVWVEVTSVSSGISFRQDAHGMCTFAGHLLSIKYKAIK